MFYEIQTQDILTLIKHDCDPETRPQLYKYCKNIQLIDR